MTKPDIAKIRERLNAAPIDFIYHARQDIPALLDYIGELEQAAREAVEAQKILKSEFIGAGTANLVWNVDKTIDKLATLVGEDGK
jgi:hypothetical protein